MTLEQQKTAQAIVPIASVRNRFSVSDGTQVALLDYCTGQDIALIPHGSLGAHPLKRGTPLTEASGILAEISQNHDASATQVALAWLLHRAPNILLIPGTTTISHLEENMQATQIRLSSAEFAQIDQHFAE